MKNFIASVLISVLTSVLTSTLLLADAGILIPRDKQQPDPAILSLEEMEITVRIDNGDARVFVRQVFANHTSGIQEGNYIFALPSHATISDFATWDGPASDSRGHPGTQARRRNLQPAEAAGRRSRPSSNGRTRRRRGQTHLSL